MRTIPYQCRGNLKRKLVPWPQLSMTGLSRALLLGLFTGGACLSLMPSAAAQCVVADVSIQAAIDGSTAPAEQTNQVEADAPESCVGNTSVHTSRQVHVGGTDNVRQVRQSRHQIEETQPSSRRRGQGPAVVVPVEVQVDVDNPADRLRW
jgi:hypothetical protein